MVHRRARLEQLESSVLTGCHAAVVLCDVQWEHIESVHVRQSIVSGGGRGGCAARLGGSTGMALSVSSC